MIIYPKNFGGLPEEFTRLETSRVIVLPVAYDGTSTWIKGADKGPDAIIEASCNMELFDIETRSEVYRQGIFTAESLSDHPSPEIMTSEVDDHVSSYLRMGKRVVTLGGEHSISIGAVRAFARQFPDLSVLQLDAHTDMREEYDGSRFNHACAMARISEIAPIVQVGIRSMDISELPRLKEGKLFLAKDICGKKEWQDQVVTLLSEQVYLTIDLDVFDPSVVPSTGTPEPGGLMWYEVIDLIRKVASGKNIVGFDVVELCPNPAEKTSDFLAAKLVYQTLSFIYHLPR
jgi:agmatinase